MKKNITEVELYRLLEKKNYTNARKKSWDTLRQAMIDKINQTTNSLPKFEYEYNNLPEKKEITRDQFTVLVNSDIKLRERAQIAKISIDQLFAALNNNPDLKQAIQKSTEDTVNSFRERFERAVDFQIADKNNNRTIDRNEFLGAGRIGIGRTLDYGGAKGATTEKDLINTEFNGLISYLAPGEKLSYGNLNKVASSLQQSTLQLVCDLLGIKTTSISVENLLAMLKDLGVVPDSSGAIDLTPLWVPPGLPTKIRLSTLLGNLDVIDDTLPILKKRIQTAK